MEVKHGIRRIELHSEDALFYGRKLGSFEVNHEAIVDLFAAVKKFPGVRQVATDFLLALLSNPRSRQSNQCLK
jgi:hypothetical protein